MNGNAAVVAVMLTVLLLLIHRIQAARQPDFTAANLTNVEGSTMSAALADALPGSVFFRPHPVFVESIQSYWARQESDIIPQCVVRPRTAEEVATAIAILKRDYDVRTSHREAPLLLAIRSGGHSPIPGSANVNGGIAIDLRLLNKVVLSNDRSSVAIGTGARWSDVSKTLDRESLAVAGGRNSAVGVGGLTLGGKYPFLGRWCSGKGAMLSMANGISSILMARLGILHDQRI